MPSLYDASDVEITPAMLDVIDSEARMAKGNHYLPELIDSGKKLQWACLVKDNKVTVYAQVVDEHGFVIFPKVGMSKDKSPFVPSWQLMLPAMQLRSAHIDPHGSMYKFNTESKPQFANKASFYAPGDDEFNEALYGKAATYMAKLDEFLNEDLVEFLCTGTTPDGEPFQDVMFKSIWNNNGKDAARVADYIRHKFDDVDDDVFRRPTRQLMSFLRHKLLNVDWDARRAKALPGLRAEDKDIMNEWEMIADTMPAEERALTYKAMDVMKAEILDSQALDVPDRTSYVPKRMFPLVVLDKSDPPQTMSQTDLYKYVKFPAALVNATIEIEGFRFNKKGALDIELVSMHVHVNGTKEKSSHSTGITNKAFGGLAPKPIGGDEWSTRNLSAPRSAMPCLEDVKRPPVSVCASPPKRRAITIHEEDDDDFC